MTDRLYTRNEFFDLQCKVMVKFHGHAAVLQEQDPTMDLALTFDQWSEMLDEFIADSREELEIE